MTSSDSRGDESQYEGFGSFVRLSGILVPTRAYFIGETYINTTLASFAAGILGAAVGVLTPLGPVLPFLSMSTIGYAFGGYQQWIFCKRRACHYIQEYPTLMALAMRQSNFDLLMNENEEDDSSIASSPLLSTATSITGDELLAWVHKGGYRRLGLSILATYSCLDAVNEIEKRRQQTIVDDLVEEEKRLH